MITTMYKARLHAMLENNNILVCKSFHEHSLLSHLSKPKAYQAMANMKEAVTNSQQSLRALIISFLLKLIPLLPKKEIIVKKERQC